MTTPQISIAGATRQGGKGENQDSFFLTKTAQGAYLGVLDGHGEFGQAVSQRAAADLLQAGPAAAAEAAVAAFATADENSKPVIISAAESRYGAAGPSRIYNQEADQTLTLRRSFYPPRKLRGGTTASVVAIDGLQVRVAHAGDSEVMVIHESGEFSVLTADHSANSLAEFLRLQAEAPAGPGSFTVKYDTANFAPAHHARPTFVRGADGNFEQNPAGGFYYSNVRKEWASYVYNATDSADALAMTRALGDWPLKRLGITSRPERLEHTLAAAGRSWVLAASDGLYDNFTYEELRDTVLALSAEGLTTEEMAQRLLALSVERSTKNFGAGGVDDITLVVATVDPEPVVRVQLAVDPGTFRCALSPADALKLAVATRGRGLGLTLAGGCLRNAVPLPLGEAERLCGTVAA